MAWVDVTGGESGKECGQSYSPGSYRWYAQSNWMPCLSRRPPHSGETVQTRALLCQYLQWAQSALSSILTDNHMYRAPVIQDMPHYTGHWPLIHSKHTFIQFTMKHTACITIAFFFYFQNAGKISCQLFFNSLFFYLWKKTLFFYNGYHSNMCMFHYELRTGRMKCFQMAFTL